MRPIRVVPALLLVLTTVGCAAAPTGGAGAAPTPGAAIRAMPHRAAAGDTVYLIQHHVRPERQQQFESFVSEVLWPAFRQAAAAGAARHDMARTIRLLSPVGPERDGTFTYTFVLDPWVRGESYNILDVLREVYPEEEAVRQYGTFTETWARDFTSHAFVQMRDPVGL
jgi:hypothetical protein